MKQDLRTGNIDALTAGELSAELHRHQESWFSRFFRERYQGETIKRIPPLVATATATSFILSGEIFGQVPPGPESGFIWRVESLFLESSSTSDAATAILYVSSDPTRTVPIVEAERKGFILGQRYYPSSKGLWVWPSEQFYIALTGATVGNQYSFTGIVAEVPAEMQGKLI